MNEDSPDEKEPPVLKEREADYQGAPPERLAEALLRFNPDKEKAKGNPKRWLNAETEENDKPE